MNHSNFPGNKNNSSEPLLCLLYLLAMLPWFFILKYLLMSFLLWVGFGFFFPMFYSTSACFYINVQPERIILKSHSFSFGQVNTRPLNLTCYKEFLIFSFLKYWITIYQHNAPPCVHNVTAIRKMCLTLLLGKWIIKCGKK